MGFTVNTSYSNTINSTDVSNQNADDQSMSSFTSPNQNTSHIKDEKVKLQNDFTATNSEVSMTQVATASNLTILTR